MAEEFLWDINWEELPDEAPSKPGRKTSSARSVVPPTAPPPAPQAENAFPQPPPQAIPTPAHEPSVRPSATTSEAGTSSASPSMQTLPKPPPLPSQTPVLRQLEKMVLVRGQRIDLSTLGCGDLVLDVAVKLSASGANICCMGLQENLRFVADAYFVFPNHTATPCGSCRLVANGREIDVRLDLTRAPAAAHRYIIAVYSDAQRGVCAHGAGTVQIRHGSAVVAEGTISSTDLGSSPCALIAEIYRRGNGWRLGILLAGTGDSLESLLRSHGADVE